MQKFFFLVVGKGYPRESPPRKLKFPPGGVRVKRRKREFVSKPNNELVNIMETKRKEQLVNIARKGFGLAHLVAQATSELIVTTEGIFVEKTLGKNREDVIKERKAVTDSRILNSLNRLNKTNK